MRIASLSPAVTEILFAIGKGQDIVCTDQFSNFPDAAKKIPHLKDHQKISPASLKEFHPEVVFLSTVIQKELAEELRQSHFSVVHQDPRTINQIYDSIHQIGIIVEAEEASLELIKKMKAEFEALKQKAKFLPSHPKVYIEEWPNPPMASGNWVPELVRLAGGNPFPIPEGELSREVSLSEIQNFQPDLMVISWCGAGLLVDKTSIQNRPEWNALPVIAQGKIKIIDDSLLNRPGPRLVEGARHLYGWLFEALHS